MNLHPSLSSRLLSVAALTVAALAAPIRAEDRVLKIGFRCASRTGIRLFTPHFPECSYARRSAPPPRALEFRQFAQVTSTDARIVSGTQDVRCHSRRRVRKMTEM